MAAAAFGTATLGGASSHREAPYISTDPTADATDFYAFTSPDKPDTVTFIANYVPGQLPGAGPNYYKLGDDVLYEINIDNNGDGVEDITYQFRFRSDLNPENAFNENTFLYNTGPVGSLTDKNLNQRQFYSVSKMTGEGGAIRNGTVLKDNLQVAPYNVGPATFPGSKYAEVAAQAVFDLPDGSKVFVGPRDDPFFIDLGGTFDLLNLGSGKDYLKGLNVHSIALQLPKALVTSDGLPPKDPSANASIIGARTTSYRQGIRVLRNLGDKGDTNKEGVINRGPWIQMSRLDLPLINEVIIPLKDKDRFNGSKPKNDGQFLSYVDGTAPGSLPDAAPHLAALLKLVLKFDAPAAPRNDLVGALLQGIKGVNLRSDVVASSQLRLNLATPVNPTPDRLGVAAGDIQGFPNG
ncbi:MAG: DUF4331 domain-containing protein, partial [Anaerolineaceae bacterium]